MATQSTTAPAQPAPPGSSPDAPGKTWTPLIALTAGIAILVASEFLPASVLPGLAADIGVSTTPGATTLTGMPASAQPGATQVRRAHWVTADLEDG